MGTVVLRVSNTWTSPCQDGQDTAEASRGCSCLICEWNGRGKPCPYSRQGQQPKCCWEAVPTPSWHVYSALVPRVPGKCHPAMGFLHESIPHGQSVPAHICADTCNKETNQLKASKQELERGKHILGLATSRECLSWSAISWLRCRHCAPVHWGSTEIAAWWQEDAPGLAWK